MYKEPEVTDVGSQLSNEAVEHIAGHAEEYCECERQRIALTNQARISALNVEGLQLTKLERQLEGRLQLVSLPGDLRSRKRKALFCWATGILLSTAAFFFSLIAFAPYRLGWIGDLYCLGIALATPYAVEEFLTAWKSERLFKAVVTAVLIAALSGGALLAAIRGDLLAQQTQATAPAIVIEGDNPTLTVPPQNQFYDSTRNALRLLMLLLSLAIDLGAGVAIHRALLLGAISDDDYKTISHELAEIKTRLATIVYEIAALTNEPDIFVARFWRDFYRAMVTQTVRKAAGKFLGLALCLLLVGTHAFAQERLNLVVALDLTASEAVKGHDQKTQFSQNVEGVKRLLASVPAGTKVTVIGITENSFAQPYILLSAELSDDPGYFGERLAAAQQRLARAWQEPVVQLEPRARQTDVFGALLLASELFRSEPNRQRKVLVIYSDMRHVNADLDLETPRIIQVDTALSKVEQRKLVPDLKGVDVYVLGADAAGRRIEQWQSLKQFWIIYFEKAEANLRRYSVLGEVSRLYGQINEQ